MPSDPLIEKLPVSMVPEESIRQLASMLGYSHDIFSQLLRSLLIEELLDRLRPSKEEIRALRMRPNHLELLKQRVESMTGVEWHLEVVEQFWQRIRLLDDAYRREPIPFHRKLQVLATKEHKCEICGRCPPEVTLHIDHIYAASKGGPNELWNLRFLCSDCNLIKSNHLDWRVYATNR
ncbi:MAG: HNH endonuclease [Acidobacteriota bacterium]|nr:HNH endonuclease [Acidobacteriota bacterium]